MARQTVKIHVSSNNAKGGVLNVKVTPWRLHLNADDYAEWELDTTGPARNDIIWFRVEQIDRVNMWPFLPPAPPDAIYTGTAPSKKATSSARDTTANKVGDVISYGLTICFKDDAGQLRTMYIDPDMVIDS